MWTYFGPRAMGKGAFGPTSGGKSIIMGLKQRGGPIRTRVIQNVRKETLKPIINENVERGTFISTDELQSYALLAKDGYEHGVVCHSKEEYVRGEAHVNSVENFWNVFKRSVRSTHIHISKKYLDVYLGEFRFRSNRRIMRNAMFDLLIGAV